MIPFQEFEDAGPGVDNPTANILVVDDTPGHLSLLVDALHAGGYRPLVASNGEAALRRVATQVPDLILLDMRMPGMDGLETLARLRELPQGKAVPVIFMTAVEEPEQKVTAFTAGAVDYVTKPFHPGEVLARIALHLRLVRTQRKLAAELTWRAQTERVLRASLEQAVLMVDAAGRVQFSTQRAVYLFERYFAAPEGEELVLPGELAERLRSGRSGEVRFEREGSVLLARIVIDHDKHELAMVMLEERRPAGDYAPLRQLGLSEREAEVLYWMSQGKSNPEIGIIVGAASGTVKKHAENIFAKLRVESRTAATLQAIDCLRGVTGSG